MARPTQRCGHVSRFPKAELLTDYVHNIQRQIPECFATCERLGLLPSSISKAVCSGLVYAVLAFAEQYFTEGDNDEHDADDENCRAALTLLILLDAESDTL